MTPDAQGQPAPQRVVPSSPAIQRLRILATELDMLDLDCYCRLRRDPLTPVLGLGPAEAPWCFFGRDPGEQEVRDQWPFVGESGVRIREVMGEFGLTDADVFWMNTVPYKPRGNKPWPLTVRRRFQPTLLDLLATWRGSRVIAFGEQAFNWFGLNEPAVASDLLRFWNRADKYQAEIAVTLHIGGAARQFTICPVPHPSRANASWVEAFPDLLRARLSVAIPA